MRWGRNRDADLRARMQILESRIKLAQAALAAFRERFAPVAASRIPRQEATELLQLLGACENLMLGVEKGDGR